MRLISLVVLPVLLVACRGGVEVRGLYVSEDGAGSLFPCDQPRTIVRVSDSALTARYRRNATTPSQLLFVRLRGVMTDSGSIYSGSHYLLVQQILEMRARRDGECPDIANPVSRLFSRRPS